MRAVVARRGHLAITELIDPVAGPGQVLVRVRACGICGSDLHGLDRPTTSNEMAQVLGLGTVVDPTADIHIGHEYCAEVLEVGPDTHAAVVPGDLTVAMPFLYAGAPPGGKMLGYSNDRLGGFGEQMVLDATLCLPVPNGLDSRTAALTEPLAVGLHAVNRARASVDDAALVLGCGPIGLACITWLRARGVGPIVASDFSPARRALAVRLGADVVVDPRVEAPIDAWQRVDGSRPLIVVEAVGLPGMIREAMRIAPLQSRVLVVGLCMHDDLMQPHVGIAKELDLHFAVFYEPEEFAQTLHAIAYGEIDVAPMLTGAVGLDGVAGAFTELRSPDAHCKIVVEPWRSDAGIEPVVRGT